MQQWTLGRFRSALVHLESRIFAQTRKTLWWGDGVAGAEEWSEKGH
jgi:hypothetical protein